MVFGTGTFVPLISYQLEKVASKMRWVKECSYDDLYKKGSCVNNFVLYIDDALLSCFLKDKYEM